MKADSLRFQRRSKTPGTRNAGVLPSKEKLVRNAMTPWKWAIATFVPCLAAGLLHESCKSEQNPDAQVRRGSFAPNRAAFSSWPASKQFPERGMPQVRLGYAKAFPFAAATPALWPGLAPLQRTPLISICVDGAPLGPNLPLTVCTSLAGAREFQIDVDLNHDGHFEASGERAYTSGSFLDRAFGPGPAIGKAGGACLRGLAPGNYQLRARVLLHGGGEMMGPVEELHVMPPPGHHLPV